MGVRKRLFSTQPFSLGAAVACIVLATAATGAGVDPSEEWDDCPGDTSPEFDGPITKDGGESWSWNGPSTGCDGSGNGWGGNYAPDNHTFPINPPDEDEDDD